MDVLPEVVNRAWEEKEGPVVLATVDGKGVPNAIYATCVAKYGEDRIVIANNFFSKTLENIEQGSKGSVLFLTKEGKSYQLKGTITYHRDGPIFEDMKKWNPAQLPGHAAAAVKVEEVYSGAEKLK